MPGSFAEELEQSPPKWRQRRYQFAVLAFVGCIAAATCGALLAVKSFNASSSSNQSNANAALSGSGESEPSTYTFTLSPTSSAPPSQRVGSRGPTLPPPSSRPSVSPTTSIAPSTSGSKSPTTSRRPSSNPSYSPSASLAPSPNGPDIFGLYVMGDVPYAPWEELMLVSQLSDMRASTDPTAMFTVHVGDIQKPARTLCSEYNYQTVSQYLLAGPLPTFVLPGDNDWADCPDQLQALGFYHKYFDYFERHWTTTAVPRMSVEYNTTYPEMWRFTYDNILFISVQLIDSESKLADWDARMAANINWIWTALDSTVPTAVIIFGQGQVSNETKGFFEGIHPAFAGARTSTPVMYIHGDGHEWDLNDKIQTQLSWPTFVDVQVDQGAMADPLIVQFSTDPNFPLQQEHSLQYVFANGLIRIDRQRGRYPVGSDGRADVTSLQRYP